MLRSAYGRVLLSAFKRRVPSALQPYTVDSSLRPKSIYRNEPEWQHSFDLRALMPEIKIICDPSHIAGDRSLIKEVSQVAMDLGMEGLMIETHRDPDCALSDAKQQITPAKLGEIIRELKIHTEVPLQPNAELATLREALDVLDDAIVDVLQKRFAKVKDIAAIQEREGLSIFHMERWLKLVQEQTSQAEGKDMSPAFIHELLRIDSQIQRGLPN